MNSFLNEVLGTSQYTVLLANLFWAYIGAFVMILLITNKRDPLSKESPVHFSWSFFFSDNVKKIVATIILIFVAIRFGDQFLAPYLPAGTTLNSFIYFLVGFGCDRLSQLFKDRNIFGIGSATPKV